MEENSKWLEVLDPNDHASHAEYEDEGLSPRLQAKVCTVCLKSQWITVGGGMTALTGRLGDGFLRRGGHRSGRGCGRRRAGWRPVRLASLVPSGRPAAGF